MEESPYKGKTGFKRLFNALFYSLDGFRAALTSSRRRTGWV